MKVSATLVLCLALGQQAVLASFKFSFSQINQCDPVSLKFSGNDDDSPIPSTLLLLPFNSTPVVIPIPNAAPNSTGVTVTFLPIAANTQFIASLDDDTGDNIAKVSDVFRVLDSPTGDSSCLPNGIQNTSLFTLPTTVSQCETFIVNYTSTIPSVRVFSPTGDSFRISPVLDQPDVLSATYTMNVTHGSQVVLMAFPPGDEGSGMTSQLMTVGGDTSSDTSCIVKSSSNNSTSTSSSNSSTSGKISGATATSSPKVSKGVVIGLSVVGALIALIGLLIIPYILRERRRKQRAARSIAFDPATLEKQPLPRPSYEKTGSVFVPNYVVQYDRDYVVQNSPDEDKYSPTYGDPVSAQRLSWIEFPATAPLKTRTALSRKATMQSAKTASSLNPYDIEQMLDFTTANVDQMPSPPPQILETSPSPTTSEMAEPSPRQMPARGHLRDPSDIPQDPTSMVSYSHISGENVAVYESPESSHFSFASSSNFEILTRPPTAQIHVASLAVPRNPPSRFSDITINEEGAVLTPPSKALFTSDDFSRDSVESWGNIAGAGIPT